MTARYTLESRLGVGGIAEVFRSRRESDSGTAVCALKRLLPSYRDDPAYRTRLFDEYAVTNSLRHPNVIEVIELVELDDVQHLALEYVDGISVDRLIARGFKGHFLPVRVTTSIARDVFNALMYVHRQGVLHRDVSAANILLSITGQTKLTDFGIAHTAHRLSSTAPGVVLGKAEYLPGDRLQGRAASTADDLFALGITIERMLAAADPRERTHPSVKAIRQFREALGANMTESHCAEVLARLECASSDEIAAFLRAPLPTKHRSGAPARPHVALDGTTIEGEETSNGASRHRSRSPHRKVRANG